MRASNRPLIDWMDIMAVRIGSARINEKGTTTGGKAGDQTGGEVSIQNYYLHRKGWYVARPKDPTVAEKIAQAMEAACCNNHIGYCQAHRDSLRKIAVKYNYNLSKVNVDVEADCSALVRVCCLYAGIQVGDFNTASELETLRKTGQFEILKDDRHCKGSTYLKRGDILVTRTKGHTVVVLDNGSGVTDTKAQTSTGAYVVGQVYTTQVDDLSVRTGPGTNNPEKSYAELSSNAQQHAHDNGRLKKGTRVTCKDVRKVGSDIWIKIPSGWIAAYYGGKKYVG